MGAAACVVLGCYVSTPPHTVFAAVFSLYDVDEDGRIGRRDLLLTLRRITNFPAGVDGTAVRGSRGTSLTDDDGC